MNPIFTVGHSTRTIDEFLDVLGDSGVEQVVDVRKLPGSSRYAQYDQDALASSLQRAGIGYQHAAGLTGRRRVSKDVPFEVNGWWENRSFHNYADYALTDDFRLALDELRDAGHSQLIAIMCSEAVWWRCHRRIIADYLILCGEDVRHILGAGHVDMAHLSRGAVVGLNGSITYPASGH